MRNPEYVNPNGSKAAPNFRLPQAIRRPRKIRPAPPIDFKTIGTAAILDTSKSPAGALLEAKVLGANNLKWLERGQIEKVVAEQNLQAVFSPEGTSQRVSLGKILKADLLVLVRAGTRKAEEGEKYLEVVVCETHRGLRLASRGLPITNNAEADAVEIENVLTSALGKLSEKITDICVVPPFLNQDLDFKYNHHSAGYARLLEQHLARKKGVLLVELAEAQNTSQTSEAPNFHKHCVMPLCF